MEMRLSPRNLKRRGVLEAKRVAWEGAAKALDLAQRTSVQAMVLGGAGALLMLFQTRKVRSRTAAKKAAQHAPGPAAKAAGAGTLWFLARKGFAAKELPERKPAVTGLALAATAAKAFLSGVKSTKKSGTTRPGRKIAWRGVATAVGSALGSYWYSHRGHRV